MDARELAIDSAIAAFNAGVYPSLRKAAKALGVPRSTLQDRINGRQSHATAHSYQQRLTPEQEAFLVEWILDEDSRAQPPSHLRVREMATRILRMNGDTQPLGQLWVPHFITRNPRVASIVGRTIESARTTAANFETIRAFLELFERTRRELGIQYEDIWNMDETGIALGVCTNHQVLASSSKKKAYIKSLEDREWVSLIECVSATGLKLQCLAISKPRGFQPTAYQTGSIQPQRTGGHQTQLVLSGYHGFLYQILHHRTVAIGCSSLMATAPTHQLSLCGFVRSTIYTFFTSLRTHLTFFSRLILLRSQ
jgi:hypothetical protein